MKQISIILIIALISSWWAPVWAIQVQETKRIALVDFRNLTGNKRLDRYKKSVPDQIQTVMARTGRLRMVERGQLESALTELRLGMDAIVDDQTAVQLGKVLNANAIVTGSYHQEGNELQFTARVIDVETSEVITGVVERCHVGGNVFGTIDRVADELIDQLQLHKWKDVLFQPQPELTEKKKRTWWIWAGVGAAALIVGGIVLSGGKDEGGTESTTLPDPPVRPGR